MRRCCALSVLAALACGPAAPPRPAAAQLAVVCPTCAGRVQQMMSYAKEVEQVATAIEMRAQQAIMVKNQFTNMMSLPERVWQQIEGNFAATQSLFSRGTHLMNSASMVSGQLSSYRNLLGQVVNMPDQYQRWSQQANDNVASLLAGYGLQRNQMAGERAAIDMIRARSAGAEGMKQAIQASTEMQHAQVNELHRLRELIMEDARMHANALNIEAERRAVEEAAHARFYGVPPQAERGNRRF
jgi:P-type conjugative transfer protein TrbJ